MKMSKDKMNVMSVLETFIIVEYFGIVINIQI